MLAGTGKPRRKRVSAFKKGQLKEREKAFRVGQLLNNGKENQERKKKPA